VETIYTHRQCGRTAFIKTGMPYKAFDALMASEIRWPDGRWAVVGDAFICGACGKAFHDPDDLIPKLYEHVERTS
jgi:hypothetical protein